MSKIAAVLFSFMIFSFGLISCVSGDVEIMKEFSSSENYDVKVSVQEEIFLPEAVTELEDSTSIFIKTSLPKADVYLNNIYQGRTPLEVKNLLPGYYLLKVEYFSDENTKTEKNYSIEVKANLKHQYYIETK